MPFSCVLEHRGNGRSTEKMVNAPDFHLRKIQSEHGKLVSHRRQRRTVRAFSRKNFHIKNGIWTMAPAKTVTDRKLKRALAILSDRGDGDRDRLALLQTHWAGMRVCEVAALTRGKVLGPVGEVLEEWRLTSDQTQGERSGAGSHSGLRGFITTLADHSVGIRTRMERAGHRQMSVISIGCFKIKETAVSSRIQAASSQ